MLEGVVMPTEAIDVLVSPRISTLQRALEVGDTAALDTFWHDIAATGTPLIEPIPDRDDVALVTFVWRAEDTTTHVVAEYCGGHQYINWRGTLPDGLMALVGTAASAS
jgi:hypothetical protein